MEGEGTGRRQAAHAKEKQAKFGVMNAASHCELEPRPNSDRTWLFMACDCSEGGAQPVQLALVFASKKLAVKFRAAFE